MIIEYEKSDEYVTWGEGTNWHEAGLKDLIEAYMFKPIYCEECKYFKDNEWCERVKTFTKEREYCSKAERFEYDTCDTDTDSI
jgi:hypothetical protein